jgi:hypothetical protein
MRSARLARLRAAKYPDWLRYGNLALAFLVELGALIGFAALGALASGWLQLVLGLIGAALFVGLWAVFAAPRSKRRLPGVSLTYFKIGMFAIAVLLLALAGQWGWALLLALAAAVNLALALVLRQH